MFDRFDPFQKLRKEDFSFQPIRYETWIGGKMVSSGKTNFAISAKVVKQNGNEQVDVTFFDTDLNHELASSNTFDDYRTSTDRKQLLIIPEETNVENMAINMCKLLTGVTRKRKDFGSNEPFACNLFFQNGVLVKITFSFSNPEKLMEFYS